MFFSPCSYQYQSTWQVSTTIAFPILWNLFYPPFWHFQDLVTVCKIRTGSVKFTKCSIFFSLGIPVCTKFEVNLTTTSRDIAQKLVKNAAIIDFWPFWKKSRIPYMSQYDRHPLFWNFRIATRSGSFFKNFGGGHHGSTISLNLGKFSPCPLFSPCGRNSKHTRTHARYFLHARMHARTHFFSLSHARTPYSWILGGLPTHLPTPTPTPSLLSQSYN